MCKLPRHITVRVEHETADAFHRTMERRGLSASDFLRAAIQAALAGAANSNGEAPRRAG